MREIKIELLKKSDWLEFYNLFSRCFENDFPALPTEARKVFAEQQLNESRLNKDFQKRKKNIILARRDGVLVGFLVYKAISGGVGILNWLWVDRSCRKQGIGSQLLSYWQKNAYSVKIHKLNLTTYASKNIGFYQKCGFVLEGIKKNDRWHQERYLLGKTLN